MERPASIWFRRTDDDEPKNEEDLEKFYFRFFSAKYHNKAMVISRWCEKVVHSNFDFIVRSCIWPIAFSFLAYQVNLDLSLILNLIIIIQYHRCQKETRLGGVPSTCSSTPLKSLSIVISFVTQLCDFWGPTFGLKLKMHLTVKLDRSIFLCTVGYLMRLLQSCVSWKIRPLLASGFVSFDYSLLPRRS